MKFTPPSVIRTTASIRFLPRTCLASVTISLNPSRQPDLPLGVSAEECQIRRIVRGQVFVRGANFPDKFDNSA